MYDEEGSRESSTTLLRVAFALSYVGLEGIELHATPVREIVGALWTTEAGFRRLYIDGERFMEWIKDKQPTKEEVFAMLEKAWRKKGVKIRDDF